MQKYLLQQDGNMYVMAMQAGRVGHCAVYYTSPQSFIITFSYSLTEQLWGLLLHLIGWLIKLSVQTFQPIIVIYKSGNLCYQFIGLCPFRSLQ